MRSTRLLVNGNRRKHSNRLPCISTAEEVALYRLILLHVNSCEKKSQTGSRSQYISASTSDRKRGRTGFAMPNAEDMHVAPTRPGAGYLECMVRPRRARKRACLARCSANHAQHANVLLARRSRRPGERAHIEVRIQPSTRPPRRTCECPHIQLNVHQWPLSRGRKRKRAILHPVVDRAELHNRRYLTAMYIISGTGLYEEGKGGRDSRRR